MYPTNKAVFECGDYTIFEITTPDGLVRESIEMRNCLYQSDYGYKLVLGLCKFYSVRILDPYWRSRAVMMMDCRQRAIVEIKGKNNSSPAQRVMPVIEKFAYANHLRMDWIEQNVPVED